VSAQLDVNGEAEYTADELIAEIAERGGRIYRMRAVLAFCITSDPELAEWLVKLGACGYLPVGAERTLDVPVGAYRRARGGAIEWDLYIHTIPVRGEKTIWEAARLAPIVKATDYR
jgi:hypothetical protein